MQQSCSETGQGMQAHVLLNRLLPIAEAHIWLHRSFDTTVSPNDLIKIKHWAGFGSTNQIVLRLWDPSVAQRTMPFAPLEALGRATR